MRRRCLCQCGNTAKADSRSLRHDGTSWPDVFANAQAARNFEGVDVTDVVGAVFACDVCRASHCEALLTRTIWDQRVPLEPETPPPEMRVTDGDGEE